MKKKSIMEPSEAITICGNIYTEHRRNGKIIHTETIKNMIVNVGKNYILQTAFTDGTQTASNSFYISWINDSGYTGTNAADTMASHGGWTEWTSYTSATRIAWLPVAGAQLVGNAATPLSFVMSAAGTLRGIFLTTNATKGGTTGNLISSALYTTPNTVAINDDIRTVYVYNM